MLQSTCIGYLGADAEVKNASGNEFTTFRIAHSDRWTDDAGNMHEQTQWVDCVMQGKPRVIEYLKKGQMVFVSGSSSLRIYSSKKDRMMKAGISINVRTCELLGGKSDDIPAVLYDANTGEQVDVKKWYQAAALVRNNKEAEWWPLVSKSNQRYVVDRNGWVVPYNGEE